MNASLWLTQGSCRAGLDSDEEQEYGLVQVNEVSQYRLWCAPTKCRETGHCVSRHQRKVNSQNESEAAAGHCQMRTAVKDVSSECSNSELGKEEWSLAKIQKSRHQPVAFS